MKLYLANGTHYEKQADVPKGTKFEAVEFPFAASPKADFVAWLNELGVTYSVTLSDVENEGLRVDAAVDAGEPWPSQPTYSKPTTLSDPAISAATIALDEAFMAAPLAQQLTLASIALEEARGRIR